MVCISGIELNVFVYLLVQCEIVTTIKLINTSITSRSSFSFFFLFVVVVCDFRSSLSQFQVYSIV